MGPKKNSKGRENKRKCPYFDRGYCQYKEECNKIHPEEVCSDKNCDEKVCNKRQPNFCKFGFRCKFFKTNICLFSHTTFHAENDKTKDIIK